MNWSGRLYELLPAFAPEFDPKLLEPLNEFVCEPAPPLPPPNGLNDPLLLNVWLPNGLDPEPDDADVPEFPPCPTFCDDEWLDDEVPWSPFGPSNVCVSDPLFDCEIEPSAPCCDELVWPDALFPWIPFWLNVSAFVCELLSDTPNWVCWCAFAAPFAWTRSPSGPIVCCVPGKLKNSQLQFYSIK